MISLSRGNRSYRKSIVQLIIYFQVKKMLQKK